MNPQTFILIGRSGCGKGTQAKLLETYLENAGSTHPVFYYESGALFREFISKENYSSKISKELYTLGSRQPTFLAIKMWASFFVEHLTGNEHFIIDGTPRSLLEAQALDTALNFYGRKANVIYLDVTRAWSEKHLLARGRADDTNKKNIEVRLNWFDTDVVPAIDYYKTNSPHNFMHIHSEQPIELVHEDIVKRIKLF